MHNHLNFTENKNRDGLQFLITAALWFDILSCVSTGKVPALPYSQWLSIPGLDTADVMGCQNWIMALIGDLASLKQWKDNSIKTGLLSTRDLAVKGQRIETALESGLAQLEINKTVNLVAPIFLCKMLTCLLRLSQIKRSMSCGYLVCLLSQH